MATEVIMPKNGMSMEEGKLIRWLKEVGDHVDKGEPLIEIETDKVTMEEPAAAEGYLLAKLASDGDTIPVLVTIGWIGAKGETPPAIAAPPPKTDGRQTAPSQTAAPKTSQAIAVSAPSGPVPATPYAKFLAAEKGVSLAGLPLDPRFGAVTAAAVLAAVPSVTPLAVKVAAGERAALSEIKGSGHAGKITRGDVLDYVRSRAAETSAKEDTVVQMSGMRKAVMRNMIEAHALIPAVTQNVRADVTELAELRAKINEGRENKFTLTDFIVKAVAKALRLHPEIMVSLGEGDTVIQHARINIGVAVALDEGLIVPVVEDADTLSLEELSAVIKDLAGRARAGKLLPDEYTGSVLTVTNMGMFGVTSFTPIINMPNAAILGVCAVEDEFRLVGGNVVVRKKITLPMTFDHRLMDGVPPARFQGTVKRF
ncbi:MAG: 2-oxo acid dehydrogenase subunit E2, partial [Synergistaceae bacterium]|nr:2-oxo acid dehydrogenase subunit E2 [Synergistaceae bacterium]